ncbi:MAG: CRISPR-associated protein Csx18 [Cyanobacteriota bacterium]
MDSKVRLSLLLNLLIAIINGSATLVVLLIAPLGLAGVVTCTVMVAVLSLITGLIGDLLLWRLVDMDRAESLVGPPAQARASIVGAATRHAVRTLLPRRRMR